LSESLGTLRFFEAVPIFEHVAQQCPICTTPVRPDSRYPRYACRTCVGKASSKDDRPLAFFNIDISGGYRAEYADTGEAYDSHQCFIAGVECRADEARFGGVVIEAVESASSSPSTSDGSKSRGLASSRADRARGLLVGLALGDALGAPVEFETPESIAGRREEIFSLPGGGPFGWAPGEFTDDTQMALVLARHLCERDGSIDQQELARQFALWAADAADVGVQTRTVLTAVSHGQTWSDATRALPPNAEGNGSLMRVAPVALAARSAEETSALAQQQSEITHPSASCVDACRVFARLLWRTVEGEVLDLPALSETSTMDAVRRAIARAEESTPPPMSGWVLHTLTGALWAVRGAASFEDAVWRAVSLGQDADTVGAVAGALAGALSGSSAIPQKLSGRLRSRHPLLVGSYPDALVELADALQAY
jgi:ADP-ribosyl-[dinitrogen reductase] hydrolase